MDGTVILNRFQGPPPPGCQGLDVGHRYRVRRHVLEPGHRLAACSHLHRAEHWVVVQGTARVTLAGQAQLCSEGQSFLVPVAQVHALENPGHIPAILIEVWIGTYLDDDDLIPDDDPQA